MTRAKISEYSATAGDNTDVNGVNIAEGCPPSSMNNMGREIMAALKRFQVGSDGDGVTVGGSLVVSGSTTANTFSATNVSASGNLTFTGTGNRITGDFSNATQSNRVMFQTSTTNGATVLAAIPSGTGNSAGIYFFNDSGFTNCARFDIGLLNSGSEARMSSTVVGSGSYVPMTFNTGGSERMRIDTSGNVGIGTSSPSYGLDIRKSTGGISWSTDPQWWVKRDSGAEFLVQPTSSLALVGTFSNHPVAITTNNTERMRIDSSGNLLVGTTSNLGSGARLNVNYQYTNDGAAWKSDSTATHNAIIFINPNGTVGTITTSGSATSYNTSSDYRLKEDIRPMTGALAKVAALKPCTYKWKADGSNGEGFIAHELQEVAPYAVLGEKDGEQMQGVDYGKLTPILTAALQEAIAKIETLEARIAVLEAK